MAIINTNTLALVSQNNLAKSQGALGQAIERLSSGLRINSAKDDAAGQAIANRFTANVNGLTQAARNANDGISIAQTTEGAINEINENLQRIRTLSVQAANGSNSDSDLRSIQAEINERLDEIDRVSKETQFNGKYVLGGDGKGLNIQVGANDDEKITINLREISTQTLNVKGFQVSTGIDVDNVGNAYSTGDKIDGPTVDANMATINAPNKTGTLSGVVGDTLYVDGTGNHFVEITGYDSAPGVDAALRGYYAVNVADNGALTLGARNSGVTADQTGLTATTQVPTKVEVNLGNLGADETLNVYAGSTAADPKNVIVQGTGAEIKYFEATINDDGTVTKGAELAVGDPTANPLATIDRALQQVDDLRSHLGAIQNRFESTIANLSNTVNNLSAARSRIEDADYAVEVSNMTRAQILQQAGTSVLAQANQVPQTALSLLR